MLVKRVSRQDYVFYGSMHALLLYSALHSRQETSHETSGIVMPVMHAGGTPTFKPEGFLQPTLNHLEVSCLRFRQTAHSDHQAYEIV